MEHITVAELRDVAVTLRNQLVYDIGDPSADIDELISSVDSLQTGRDVVNVLAARIGDNVDDYVGAGEVEILHWCAHPDS